MVYDLGKTLTQMRFWVLAMVLIGCFASEAVHAQGWGRVEGTVREATSGEPMPGVTVIVNGTNFGTATGTDGSYNLRIPEGRKALRFSFVGYETRIDSVFIPRDGLVTFNVALNRADLELDEVLVQDERTREAGVVEIDPETIEDMPAPFHDGFRILKVQPGVASNNELSNEYSVRGGGYNENLVYINGFEVYKPFRVRQGEQEGLGLVNPDLTQRMTFYTGGFPARFGGKLSSALDVQYKRPGVPSGSAYASMLDAGGTIGAAGLDGRLYGMVGVRKARARRLFGTQELKGQYDPDYTDVQATLGYQFAQGHTLEALGLWARHEFRFEPSNRRTFFGTFNNLQSIWINYAGDERDGYETGFAGLRLTSQLTPTLRAEHALAYFDTDESEQFDIRGSAVLYLIDNPFEANPESGEGLIPTGSARQEDFANNQVHLRTLTGQGRYLMAFERIAPEMGWYVRSLQFGDALNEKSIVSGRSTEGLPVRIVVDSLNAAADFDANQAGGYIQNTFDLLPQRDQLVVTAGLRADYFSFNEEWTFSPRLTARMQMSENLTLMGSLGVYHQNPTYRELRGTASLEAAGTPINRDLKSQRAIQWVGGMEYFLTRQRMYIRAEAYYKNLDRLISYGVENVRVTYSGENDTQGQVYGLDLQLRGEFVPGLESWLNYGFMVGREEFLPSFQTEFNEGTLARPTDQRHTFSLFIQDYVPNDPTWKLHMRILFGTGLPYTPPVPGETVGNIQLQASGKRNSERYPEYKRLDLGATKTLNLAKAGFGEVPVRLKLTAEVLNVFDMVNTVAYTWVTGADGIWNRVPTRLTPRTFNLRARVEF